VRQGGEKREPIEYAPGRVPGVLRVPDGPILGRRMQHRHLTHRVGILRRAATAAALAALHMNGASGREDAPKLGGGERLHRLGRLRLPAPLPVRAGLVDSSPSLTAWSSTRRKVGKFVLRVLSAMWVRRPATSASYLGRRFRGVRSQVA